MIHESRGSDEEGGEAREGKKGGQGLTLELCSAGLKTLLVRRFIDRTRVGCRWSVSHDTRQTVTGPYLESVETENLEMKREGGGVARIGCRNAVAISAQRMQSFYSSRLVSQRQREPETTADSSSYQLKYLNAGAGTTGTRSIYHLFCRKWQIKSLHHSDECNTRVEAKNQLSSWYSQLIKCSLNSLNPCRSNEMLNSLAEILPGILSEYEFISDSPTELIFLEIYALMSFKVWFLLPPFVKREL
jgi:hypothetical protein